MITRSFAAEACRAVLLALLLALLGAFSPPATAQPRALAELPGAPATSLAEASQLFRAGRHAAAYGRFVRLANEGDREAARIALVMHRHGGVLFGSAWDASTDELVHWSLLAQAADRAEIAARDPVAAKAVAVGSAPGEAAYLAPETFRGDRRRKR